MSSRRGGNQESSKGGGRSSRRSGAPGRGPKAGPSGAGGPKRSGGKGGGAKGPGPKGSGSKRQSARGSGPKGSSTRNTDDGDTRSRSSGPDQAASRGRKRGGGGGRSGGPRGLGGDQVEGRHAVRELLLAGTRRCQEILLASDLDPAPIIDDITELAREARVVVRQIGRGRLESLARTEAPQGVIARAAELVPTPLDQLIQRSTPGGGPPFLLALDGVTDPGNLGTLLRTAEGAGVTGVVLPRHRAARITPTVTKAAAGAVEYLPIAQVGGLASAMSDLGRAGVWSLGLDGAGEVSLFDASIPDTPVVLVLGAEGKGLSRLVGERCDLLAAIPRRGRLDSINVAAAGAVACYEVARSRTG